MKHSQNGVAQMVIILTMKEMNNLVVGIVDNLVGALLFLRHLDFCLR